MAFRPGGYSLRVRQVVESFGIDPNIVHDLSFNFPRNGIVTATITVAVMKEQLAAIEDAMLDVQSAEVVSLPEVPPMQAVENFMPGVQP
jgi:hypothetical protein